MVCIILVLSFVIGGPFGIVPEDIFKSLFFIFLLPGLIVNAGIKFRIWGYNMPDETIFEYFFAAILSIIPYFILGALIGWIYGKIKSRKVE